MNAQRHEKIIIALVRLLCFSAITISLLVLIGWFADNTFLKGIKPEYVPMAPNTALLFILLSTACILLTTKKEAKKTIYTLLGISLAINLVRLFELLMMIKTNSSNWFLNFPTFSGGHFAFPIGQTSFPTVLAFLAITASLIFTILHHRFALSEVMATAFAGIGLWMGLMFFLGYTYHNPLLYGGTVIPMAVNTAFVFILLGGATFTWSLGKEIIERKQEKEEAENAKNRFLSMISHELRTPLTPIRTHIEMMISNHFTEQERKKSLQIILRNSIRLNTLINDLLDATRIQSGNLKIYKQPNSIKELIDQAAEIITPLAKDKKINIKKKIQKTGKAEFDKDRLLQVLINLLTNAIKHSEATEITISAEEQNGYFVISVKDNGIGITAEQKERLFSPFNASKISAASKGAGLGLYICKSIITQHKGKIWIENKKGTTITFKVPKGEKNEKENTSSR